MVNSYFIAELLQKDPKNRIIGISVSIRGQDQSLNNLTSGIRIKHQYHTKQSVSWNAIQIHKKVQKKHANKRQKYLTPKQR